MTEHSHAVFLSYASQDVEAAQKISETLRAAGTEVWFDQSELRGGEAWDRKIRKQIHDCALFIPVISANAHARDEGYFRLEWKLAVDRSHLMSPDKTFLLPVVIDNTPQTDERIPDRFRELQWSRLPDGQVPPAFIERVQRLLSPAEPDAVTTIGPATRSMLTAASAPGAPARVSWGPKRVLVVTGVLVILGALASVVVDRLWTSKKPAAPPASPAPQASAAPAAFSPPPHSIAVLPFVNMSGDKEQEYFSDGLTEELLNSLSRINELQVAARTSSFSFKGKDTDIDTIAHKLNVGAVLEGSVRRSAHTVRITAQLINAANGYHLWSETYDRDLKDVLKLQTEIANAVASALKVTLLSDVASKIEMGGTRNPAAFDAYLRAMRTYFGSSSRKDVEAAIAGYSDAIHLDPDYALAYAGRSFAFSNLVANWPNTTPSAVHAGLDTAQADARKAIVLAPNLGEGHAALAVVYLSLLEFTRASQELEHARTLAPGDARVLWNYGEVAAYIGRGDAGIAAAHRAVVLDPLNAQSHFVLGESLLYLRRYAEAIAAFNDAESVSSGYATVAIAIAYYLLGDMETARSYCEKERREDDKQFCLAMVYEKLGRHADAEMMLDKLHALDGDSGAWSYSATYAQWGETARALDWLETAMRWRSPDLAQLKNPLFDPLRHEPRFQAIERALRFPD